MVYRGVVLRAALGRLLTMVLALTVASLLRLDAPQIERGDHSVQQGALGEVALHTGPRHPTRTRRADATEDDGGRSAAAATLALGNSAPSRPPPASDPTAETAAPGVRALAACRRAHRTRGPPTA